MRVPSVPLGRFLTIAAGVAACVAACQSPEQFFRDGGANSTGRGGSSGGSTGPGTGGVIGFGGSGGTSPQGTGGTVATTGSGGRGGSGGTVATTGSGGRGGSGGTTGAGGSAVDAGVERPAGCPTCKLKVMYTCRGTQSNQASLTLRVINNAPTTVPLANVTIRYWYTTDDAANQVGECDYTNFAGGMCANVLRTFMAVTPARPKANVYMQLAFDPTLGVLEGFHDVPNDGVQLRIHTGAQYLPGDQMDDYSYDCTSLNTEIEATNVTAYVGTDLVWGTEP